MRKKCALARTQSGGRFSVMKRADELRLKASLYRQTASHSTQGGSAADRILKELADRLEREAAEAERIEPGADGRSSPAS